ncbi:Rho GTPase activation protein [Blakeslea trispora]|nr:Rho GTPase activation protein [Blakeslea trispora]
MSLIAIWDYTAEGELELSFRKGDKIRLLEKHNDDWWEGQLGDEIGFFPANRVKAELLEDQDSDVKAVDSIPQQIPLEHHDSVKSDTEIMTTKEETVDDHPLVTVASAPAIMNKLPLPNGWQEAYAPDGSLYYFNEATRQTTWDRPVADEAVTDQPLPSPPPPSPPPLPPRNNTDLDDMASGLTDEDLSKLKFDRLQQEWVRHQGYVEMKMVSEKDAGSKLSSWKVYFAVLSNGFLLLYKESHAKYKKSSKSRIPIGSFDLDSCKIDPAGKQDTKRKHVFIISTPRQVKLYIQAANNSEFSSWLDAIMRELIARKEGQNEDSDIMRLLKSLSIDESQMKVNRKMIQEDESRKKYWFSSKQQGKSGEFPDNSKTESKQADTFDGNAVFGGELWMEENDDVPRVVSACIQQVEKRGLKSVGIYRLSGPASSIQKYKAMFDQGENVSLDEEYDINAITGLLKLYFRELSNPLMTYEYYEWFIDAARIPEYEERMYQIKSIIHSLPKKNFIVLEYLMRHLNRVASFSEINKMEPSNLALIFSVGLLRAPQEDLSSIMMSDLQSKVVEAIIQQVDWFFENEDNTQE